MTVVNFLCRREKLMMKKKVKIVAAVSTAIISLLIIPLYNQPPQESPDPNICPVSPSLTSSRDNTPPIENKAVVADESPEISTPRDNHTPTPAPSKNTTVTKACEPKMGDTRTVDGQKQSYFIGFGWINDNDKPNECIYVEDMYENGNKIGSMGGGKFLDGEGDINKMVGRMD